MTTDPDVKAQIEQALYAARHGRSDAPFALATVTAAAARDAILPIVEREMAKLREERDEAVQLGTFLHRVDEVVVATQRAERAEAALAAMTQERDDARMQASKLLTALSHEKDERIILQQRVDATVAWLHECADAAMGFGYDPTVDVGDLLERLTLPKQKEKAMSDSGRQAYTSQYERWRCLDCQTKWEGESYPCNRLPSYCPECRSVHTVCEESTLVSGPLLPSTGPETAWLIETVDQPTHYYVADGDWCNNANHGHRFPTQQEAEQARSSMISDRLRVCEHLWLAPAAPAPTQEQEKA